MQFKTTALSLALAALSAAQPMFLTQPASITAGSTATWTWSNAAGPVTLTLRTGDAGNLGVVTVLASGATASSFTWAVPPGTVNGQYALEITDGTTPNYSAVFTVSGGASGTIATIATTGASTAVVTRSSTATVSSTTGTLTSTSLSTVSTSSGSSSSASSRSSTSSGSSSSRTSSASTTSTSAPNLNGAANVAAAPFALLISGVLGLFVL